MTRLLIAICMTGPLIACQRNEHRDTQSAAPTPPVNGPAALDQLDTRVPVPLLPMMANHQKQNMRDHLVAVQDIVLALATDDYAGIERAAKRIGYSDEMGQMCTHMGAGAQGFTEQSIKFHHTADGIAAAARSHDRAKVVSQLGVTLQTCTACHALWKQRVVDDATWSQVTAQALPAPR
jgi:hypothetical protein